MNKQDITRILEKFRIRKGILEVFGTWRNNESYWVPANMSDVLNTLETVSTQVRKEERERIAKAIEVIGQKQWEEQLDSEEFEAPYVYKLGYKTATKTLFDDILASLTPQVKEECTCYCHYPEGIHNADFRICSHCQPQLEKAGTRTYKQTVETIKKIEKKLEGSRK